MVQIHSVELTNYHLFKDTTFEFTDGVTMIRGQNGSGKSLLFNSIPTAFFYSPPMGEKKNAASTFLPPAAGAKIHLRTADDENFAIHQYRKGKSIKYDLEQDNKSKGIRVIAKQKEAIDSIVNCAPNLFYSSVFVSAYRPSPLWLGSASQRYDFFEDIFDLGFYDTMYKEINKRLGKLRVTQAELKVHANNLHDLSPIIKKSKVSRAKAQLQELQAQKKRLHRELNVGAYDELQTAQEIISLHESLVFHKLTDATAPEKLQAKLDELKGKRSEIRETLDKLRRAEAQADAAQEDFKIYERARKRLEKLKKYEDYDAEALKEQRRKLKKKLRKLQEQSDKVRKYRGNISEYKKYDLAHFKIPKAWRNKTFTKKGLDAMRERLVQINHHRSLYEKLVKDQVCPVCGTEHKNKTKAEFGGMSLSPREARKECETYLRCYVKIKVEAKFDIEEIDGLEDKIDKVEQRIDECDNTLRKIRELKIVKRQMPKSMGDGKDVSISRKELQAKQKKLRGQIRKLERLESDQSGAINDLKQDLKVWKRILQKDKRFKDIASCRARIKKVGRTVKKKNRQYQEIEERYTQARIDYDSLIERRRQQRVLKKKVEKLKKKCEAVPRLTLLKKAFSPQGMRINHMTDLVNSYVAILNELSPYLYKRPFKFSAELGSRSFNLLVERPNKAVSDVRYLSGFESHAFLAASAVAIRRMVDPKKRFDNLIFDEIESGMIQENRDRLFNSFVPYVLAEVPSLTFITPYKPHEFSASEIQGKGIPLRELEIVPSKSKSRSEIVARAA